MSAYLTVLFVAFAVTVATTPLVRRVAIRIGAVVPPDIRRPHQRPTPTLGGIAMFCGFLAAMATAARLDQFQPVFSDQSQPLGVVIAAAIILGVGVIDDLREVTAPAKIAGMVLAGSALSLFGVTMLYFRVPFAETYVLSADMAPLVTVLWVVCMANAINLIDGLDGLAAGIVAIAAGAFAVYSDRLFDQGLLPANTVSPLLAVIVLGICLGFLPHNFNPARIFMGDGGALLLGLLMAAATLLVGGRSTEGTGQTYFFFAPLVIPFVILGVPILDTVFAVARRTRQGRSFAEADKEHLHHRLMRLGHGPRRAVIILWMWTAILSGVALVPSYTDRAAAALPFLLAAVAGILYTVLHPDVRRARAEVDGEGDVEAAVGIVPVTVPDAEPRQA